MIKLKINKEVFSRRKLELSISEFSNLADIKISDNRDHYLLEFSQCKYDENKTVLEFENYLIELENN